MGIRNWGASLSWVALPGFIAGFVSLGCIGAAGQAEAMPATPTFFLHDHSLPAPEIRTVPYLRLINVTPAPLAMVGPGESGWGAEEAPVAERDAADPLMPAPDRAPFPTPGVPGEGPLPGLGAMPNQDGMPGQGGLPGAGASPSGIDAEAVFADPAARAQMLDQLYDALASSPDAEAASRLQDAIQKIWLRTGSPTIDLLLARAILLEDEGDYDLALEILNAAISLSPDTAEIWHQRAMVHFLREEHSRALSDLRRTLALDPKHYEAITGLGRVLEHLGQKESALAVFRRALQVNPYLEPARLAVEELSREIEGQDI